MEAVTRYSLLSGLSLLLLVLFVSLASAGDEYAWPEEYTILCSSEKSTGLDWEDGDWKIVQYKDLKRLIVKSKENQCLGVGSLKPVNNIEKEVCLNVRRVEHNYVPGMSRLCIEGTYGVKHPNLMISCDLPRIILSPNGWYHYSKISGDLDDAPKDDLKDSQYIEVGKCSMIKP
ncbi:MAG TPA: hypothetical protein PKK23_05975 [Nitrospirales bacterium]|nr:hypothetical protein [Nitrospiraceae bacterium]HNP28572.1 hypothetical protein [Nitrospirales bacterium]